jgi:exopolysaccharide biosynthesis predicted pyruvyltransferase EpsI
MIAAAPSSRRRLIAFLKQCIDDSLRPLLADEAAIALLDFPNHPNVGDSAIWLGTTTYLRSLGIRIAYSCDDWTYSRAHLAQRIGRGTIVLAGGGNLGDLWPHHHRFREEVISAFPTNRIVQLPQSIYFGDRAALTQAQRVFNAHPNLILLLRDARSLAIARHEFRAPSMLCPDMALWLGELPPPVVPTCAVEWLARSDGESVAGRPADGVQRLDWVTEPATLWNLIQRASRRLKGCQHALRWARQPLSWTYDRAAAQRLQRGVRRLSSARVVITDRLHAHLLCILLGIPHVLMNSRSGKVRSFFDTWTHSCELTRWCDDPLQAIRMAEEFGGDVSRGTGERP